MSEDFSDDFIIEEEEQGANRTFLIIAGSLVSLFLLIIACVALFAFLNREDNSDQIAAIETQNAETAAQNARVTETIVAMELTAAVTNTPTPTSTPSPTNTPTSTPEPTDTAVVQTPGTEETPEGGDGTVTVTPNLAGTQIFGGGGTFGTSTPISGAGGTGTGGTSTGGGDTLPQTGVTTAGAVGVGLLLIVVLVVARRLRTG